MKKYFLPRNENSRLSWLQNFSNKIGSYAAKYGITAAEVADMVASYLVFAYWLNFTNQYKGFVSKLVEYKNEQANIKDAAGVVPGAPALPAAPPAVESGIFIRAAYLGMRIKSHNLYTVSDGNDLLLEGDELQHPDLNTVKPEIQLRLTAGGSPEILWVKASFDGIDIYVDRGAGTWVFLATDTIPNFTDTAALPAAGHSAVWKYKTIYRLDDAHVGQWSDEMSITVTGTV